MESNAWPYEWKTETLPTKLSWTSLPETLQKGPFLMKSHVVMQAHMYMNVMQVAMRLRKTIGYGSMLHAMLGSV